MMIACGRLHPTGTCTVYSHIFSLKVPTPILIYEMWHEVASNIIQIHNHISPKISIKSRKSRQKETIANATAVCWEVWRFFVNTEGS